MAIASSPDHKETFSALMAVDGPLAGFALLSDLEPGFHLFATDSDLAPQVDADPAFLARLRSHPEILSANPVFLDPTSRLRLIPMAQVLVHVASQCPPSELLENGVRSVRRVNGTTDHYVIELADLRAETLFLETARLSQDHGIIAAEPNFLSEVRRCAFDDPLLPYQWHLSSESGSGGVGAVDVWDSTQGSGVVISVLDNGVQTSHPDLAPNIASLQPELDGSPGVDDDGNGYIDDIHGWDFFRMAPDPGPQKPGDNHGTAAAGVAAARGNNAVGGSGVAPRARILPVRFIDDQSAYVRPDRIEEAILYAAGRTADGTGRWRGADVISMSFGTAETYFITQALHWAAVQGRDGKGLILLAATGNTASPWEKHIIVVPSRGPHTLRWEYSRDATGSGGENRAWIDEIWFISKATRECALIADFDLPDLPSGWSTYGNAPWHRVVHDEDGNHAFTDRTGPRSGAMASGEIGPDQTTSLQLDGEFDEGWIVFLSLTSTEAQADFLRWSLDGQSGADWCSSGVPAVIADASFPASHPDVIGVGACTQAGYRSEYSNYGAELDFVAPSTSALGISSGILTTDRTGTDGYAVGDFYSSFGGTSAACPLAAGIAALALSVRPELHAEALRRLMQVSCDQIGDTPYVNGTHLHYGYGRVNAQKVLRRTPVVLPPDVAPALEPPQGISEDGQYVISWQPVDGALEYELQEFTDPSMQTTPGSWQRFRTTATSLSFSRKTEGVWYYQVRAAGIDSAGRWVCGPLSDNAVTQAVDFPEGENWPPPPPTLRAGAGPDTDGLYRISWDAVPGAIAYELFEFTEDPPTWRSGSWRQYRAGGQLFYDFRKETDGMWYYRGRSWTTDVHGQWIAGGLSRLAVMQMVQRDPADIPLPSPTLKQPTHPSTDGRIILRWDPVPGAKLFEVFEFREANPSWTPGSWKQYNAGILTSLGLSKIESGSWFYSIRVWSQNSQGEWISSRLGMPPVEFIVDFGAGDEPPAAPVVHQQSEPSRDGRYVLSWYPVSGRQDYEVFEFEEDPHAWGTSWSGHSWRQIKVSGQTQLSFVKDRPCVWYYMVRAWRINSTGEWIAGPLSPPSPRIVEGLWPDPLQLLGGPQKEQILTAADADGDGVPDSSELTWGTDAMDRLSHPLRIVGTEIVDGLLHVSFQAWEGGRFQIEWSPDLASWEPAPGSVPSSIPRDGVLVIPVSIGSTRHGFLRVCALQP